MTLDAYLARLQDELRQRGVENARILDEARDHLVDAIEDGRRRGLSVDEAGREAIDRFGAPEVIAAQAAPERDRMTNRFTGLLDTAFHRKWWLLAPTIVTAAVTSAATHYLVPVRYRSESVIQIQAPRVAGYASSVPTDGSAARFQQVAERVLSRTRLERIIRDFDLHQSADTGVPRDDVVDQMRRNIAVSIRASDSAPDDGVGTINVSFVASDATTALKITERLAGLIIEESLREREVAAQGTRQFIESQITELRRRIIDYENSLENLRAQSGQRALSRSDLLPYEVLQERYKALLVKSEEINIAAHIERRQIGERFVVVDPPQLPERPVGPSRSDINLAGAFAGLCLGLVLVWGRSAKSVTP